MIIQCDLISDTSEVIEGKLLQLLCFDLYHDQHEEAGLVGSKESDFPLNFESSWGHKENRAYHNSILFMTHGRPHNHLLLDLCFWICYCEFLTVDPFRCPIHATHRYHAASFRMKVTIKALIL